MVDGRSLRARYMCLLRALTPARTHRGTSCWMRRCGDSAAVFVCSCSEEEQGGAANDPGRYQEVRRSARQQVGPVSGIYARSVTTPDYKRVLERYNMGEIPTWSVGTGYHNTKKGKLQKKKKEIRVYRRVMEWYLDVRNTE